MKFFERVRLIEKRKRTNEKMGNRQSDDDELPDSPSTGGDADAHDDQEAELDAEDTMEMKEKKDKDWIQKAVDPDHEGYCTPMTKSTCTPRRKALAKTFKKMGRERDAKIVSKKEKAAAKK
jgi:hypothetical protein